MTDFRRPGDARDDTVAAAKLTVAPPNTIEAGADASTYKQVSASGAALALDVGQYRLFDVVLDQNCTISFTNALAGSRFTAVVRGAFIPTFAGTIKWPAGVAPTYSNRTVYDFVTVNGTTWYGVAVGTAFPA